MDTQSVSSTSGVDTSVWFGFLAIALVVVAAVLQYIESSYAPRNSFPSSIVGFYALDSSSTATNEITNLPLVVNVMIENNNLLLTGVSNQSGSLFGQKMSLMQVVLSTSVPDVAIVKQIPKPGPYVYSYYGIVSNNAPAFVGFDNNGGMTMFSVNGYSWTSTGTLHRIPDSSLQTANGNSQYTIETTTIA